MVVCVSTTKILFQNRNFFEDTQPFLGLTNSERRKGQTTKIFAKQNLELY